MRPLGAIVHASILAWASAAAAQSWSLEAYLGDAYNFKTRLKIEQDGGYSRSLNAGYETRGFQPPLYWMLRGARWEGEHGWELSLLHHKLYLANPPDGVASLSVSHGFNILGVSRAYRAGDWVYRLGAGPVVTHAEASINGVSYDGPYRLSGAAILAGGGRRFYVGKAVFLSLEAMFTAARTRPKLDGPPDARITVNNIALHGLAGLGYEF